MDKKINDQLLPQKVRDILFSNITAGYSNHLKKHYFYINPARDRYPFQYFWDTCFHVFILCCLKEYEVAKRNIESLFAMQEKSGFVGHVIFWQKTLPRHILDVFQATPTLSHPRPHMSSLIQPPLVAQAVLRIYEETHDKNFVIAMLPKIKKYFNWLAKNRDHDDDGLISIISPFESGIDWKPSYDEVLGFNEGKANDELYRKVVFGVDFANFMRRYNQKSIYAAGRFIVKDALYNTFYVLDLHALAKLCSIAADPDGHIFTTRAKRGAARMLELMYNERDCAFYDLQGKSNRQLKRLTFTIFFPMAIEEISSKICSKIIERHLFNKKEFALSYPIPSVSLSEPSFDPHESKYLWRGPTWVVANWFIVRCLFSRGYKKEGDDFIETVKKLIEKSGFREYYNPLNGEGYGAQDFTWSGLILDMMLLRNKHETDKGKSELHEQTS